MRLPRQSSMLQTCCVGQRLSPKDAGQPPALPLDQGQLPPTAHSSKSSKLSKSSKDAKMIVIHPSKFFRVEVVVGAAVLAAWLLALVGAARPAEAAFPGANGKIVFASERTSGDAVDNPEGDSEIFTMNPDGSELTQLTHNDTDDEDPVYSADGRQIAFVRWREWDPEDFQWTTDIYTMSADGRNETRVTSTDLSNEFSPSWSPDGNYIAFELFDPD